MSGASGGRRVVVLGLSRALRSRKLQAEAAGNLRRHHVVGGLQRDGLEVGADHLGGPSTTIPTQAHEVYRQVSPAPAPSTTATGSRLRSEFRPPYREVARGGFGRVLRAVHKIDLCEYALKVSRGGANEVRALAALGSHPNIVRYFGSWYERGGAPDASTSSDEEGSAPTLCIQLELCAETLRQWLETNWTRRAAEVRDIANALTAALGHVHAADYAHLDVAAANVLRKPDGTWCLGDFGLARPAVHPALPPADGQSLYMAPERKKTSPEPFDLKKADVFSLGVVFFELCASFRTEMERALVLEKLHLHIPPSTDTTAFPRLASMLDSCPTLRPDALVVLRECSFS